MSTRIFPQIMISTANRDTNQTEPDSDTITESDADRDNGNRGSSNLMIYGQGHIQKN